jgi:hypothetical protein
MECTLQTLEIPHGSSKKRSRARFVVYEGGPSQEVVLRTATIGPKPQTRLLFQKNFTAAEAHCMEEMRYLDGLVRHWQSVCARLELKSRRENEMTGPISRAIVADSMTSSRDHMIGISSKSTLLSKPKESAVQDDGEANEKSPKEHFVDLMWRYFDVGAALVWPGFRTERVSSVKTRCHAWDLASKAEEKPEEKLKAENNTASSRPMSHAEEDPKAQNTGGDNKVHEMWPDSELEHTFDPMAHPRPWQMDPSLASRLRRQPSSILLSIAENIIGTSMGCHFWLIHRRDQSNNVESSEMDSLHEEAQQQQPPHDTIFPTSSSTPSNSESFERTHFCLITEWANQGIAGSLECLHFLLLLLRSQLRHTHASHSNQISYSIADTPLFYVRFMNLCLLFAFLCLKQQKQVRGRVWLDLATWLSRNGNFASHLPQFTTIRRRILVLLLEYGTYSSIEWLDKFDKLKQLAEASVGVSATPYPWIDTYLEEKFSSVTSSSLRVGEHSIGVMGGSEALIWLFEQHVSWVCTSWQESKGTRTWKWVDEAAAWADPRRRPQYLKKGDIGVAPKTPQLQHSNAAYQAQPVWLRFEESEQACHAEAEFSDSSETMEDQKDVFRAHRLEPPAWLDVSLVSLILSLASTAILMNFAEVSTCLSQTSAQHHDSKSKVLHHPWFGDSSKLLSRQQIPQIRRAWAALVRVCGSWIARCSDQARSDEILVLRLQYNLVASQLVGLVHGDWHPQLDHCFEILRYVNESQRPGLLSAVRSKVEPDFLQLEGSPASVLSEYCDQLAEKNGNSMRSPTYQTGSSERMNDERHQATASGSGGGTGPSHPTDFLGLLDHPIDSLDADFNGSDFLDFEPTRNLDQTITSNGSDLWRGSRSEIWTFSEEYPSSNSPDSLLDSNLIHLMPDPSYRYHADPSTYPLPQKPKTPSKKLGGRAPSKRRSPKESPPPSIQPTSLRSSRAKRAQKTDTRRRA